MKFYSLLTLMFLIFSTGSVMCMEQDKKGRLNFGLDKDLCIKSYSKQNMEFKVPAQDFLGKSIIEVIPLDPEDRLNIARGFGEAITKKETVKVPYILDSKGFVATITALKTQQKKQYEYFVKVTQANNNQ